MTLENSKPISQIRYIKKEELKIPIPRLTREGWTVETDPDYKDIYIIYK